MIEFIAHVFTVPIGEVVDNAKFYEELNGTKRYMRELVKLIQEQFGIEITDEERDGFETVGELLTLVVERVG